MGREVIGSIDNDTIVILTPFISRDIVIEFNEENYVQLLDKLYYIDDFRYSEQVLGDIMYSNAQKLI